MKSIAIDIAEPTGLPLDLDTLKQDLRIDDESGLDEVLVTQYIPAALSWAEGVCHRTILAREHRWILSGFPCGAIVLPRGKAQSVLSVEYSSGGSMVKLYGPTSSPEGSDYQEDLRGPFGRLMPPRGSTWPSADTDAIAPVVITFIAGWAKADIPKDIKRAMTVAVSDAVEVPGFLSFNSAIRDPEFAEKLISAWRLT